jgi:hypothetical protein
MISPYRENYDMYAIDFDEYSNSVYKMVAQGLAVVGP